MTRKSLSTRVARVGATAVVLLTLLVASSGITYAQQLTRYGNAVPAQKSADRAQLGPGSIIVTPAFQGQLAGWDIDSTGTEGLLSEYSETAKTRLSATETFDLTTGKILKVLKKTITKINRTNEYGTWGIFNHVGLDEHYKQKGQKFLTVNPLNGNKFTGVWTPPNASSNLLWQVAADPQGGENSGVLDFQDSGNFNPVVFSTNIAANTSGPQITVTDPVFCICLSPMFAYDANTNQALLAGSFQGFGTTLQLALIDLETEQITELNTGLGNGGVLGLAVDSTHGIVVATSYYDNGVEFYDLNQQSGIEETIPCSERTFGAAEQVKFDPANDLFLVGQFSGNSCDNGGRMYVYDEQGNLMETLTGFQIGPIDAPFALHPSDRSGFVFQNRLLGTLQSFTY